MNDTPTPMAQDALVGLAFPVIRVRYAGPTYYKDSRYIATLRGVRHTESYDYALGGSGSAYNAAVACWDKYRAQHADAYAGDDQPCVFIPGDVDASSYSFTVVPAGFLTPADDKPAEPAPIPPVSGVDGDAVARLEAFAAEAWGEGIAS